MYCRVILTVLLFAVVPFSPHSHLKKTGLLVRNFEKVRFLLNGPGLKIFSPYACYEVSPVIFSSAQYPERYRQSSRFGPKAE